LSQITKNNRSDRNRICQELTGHLGEIMAI